MAGLLGGIFGKESEQPDVAAPEALARSEAFAAAVAANIAGSHEGVARKTEIFLDRQAQLLETQNHHLKDEHALRLANLRNQIGEQALRRQGMKVRVAAQYIFASLGAVLCVGVIVMVYDAFHSRNVIIDPFEIAPGLNASIPSGKIVAAGLLDRLTQLQADTRTSAQKRGLSNAWANEISIQVPQTGLSIGQIVVFGFSLALFRRVIGITSPWFGLLIMFDFLGLVAFARQLILLRLPAFLRPMRKWERTGQFYKALRVPAFGALLRRTPLRHLNAFVYLKQNPSPSIVRAQRESAEVAHLLAAVLLVPYIGYACVVGWWEAVAWLLLVKIGFNVYPIFHLRWVRVRISRLKDSVPWFRIGAGT